MMHDDAMPTTIPHFKLGIYIGIDTMRRRAIKKRIARILAHTYESLHTYLHT